MANEINLSLVLSIAKNGATVSASPSLQEDLSGTNIVSNVQTVGTSQEAITLGDVSNPPGLVYVKNLDDTNYVEVDDVTTFDDFPQKLLAGQFVLLRPQTNTLYAKANTAPVDIQVIACDV